MPHIRKGDQVVVINGSRAKNSRGKVKRILGDRVEIEKVLMVKRHTKPSQKNPQGGIISKEGSIAISNVSLWCSKCVAARRFGVKKNDTGDKIRICKRCGSELLAQAS